MRMLLISPLFIVLLISLLPLGALAQPNTACRNHAKTDYERLYCDIQDKGANNLPTFDSFRANPPRLQAILLKRPAQKYGLTVPALPKTRAPQPTKPKRNVVVAPPPKTIPKKHRPSSPDNNTSSNTKTESQASGHNLSNCQLLKKHIQCPNNRYLLTLNQSNRQLSQGALTKTNRFNLEGFNGNPNDSNMVNQYLAGAYRHYIEKMLNIGLGGATMSYTKFHYTFMELAKKEESFSQRFETMYGYLKSDRASMGVKEKYHEQLPDSIQLCQDLSDAIVVCDNGKLNWVYVRN